MGDQPPGYAAADPYAVVKPVYDPNAVQMQPVYDPNSVQQQPMAQPMPMDTMGTMGQPMMAQPYGVQYNTMGQPMMMAQPYGGQPMMMAQPYGQPMMMMQPGMMTPGMMQPGMMGGGQVVVQVQSAGGPVLQAAPVAAVVVAKEPEFPGYKKAISVYEEGLLCCQDDCETCCKGCFCPCLTFGRVARFLANDDAKEGDAAMLKCSIGSLLGLYLCCAIPQRVRLKTMAYGKPKSCDIEDCCAHTFCGPCALCQEERMVLEIKKERKEKEKKLASVAPVSQNMS